MPDDLPLSPRRPGIVKSGNSTPDVARARLFLIILALSWGITWVTMRIALTEIPPFSMRVGTISLGAIMLIVLARLRGKSLRIANRRTWLHLCVTSFFNIVCFSVFTPFGM